MTRDGGPRALTLDLWHTLLYLEPEDEEAYMTAQMDLATSILDAAPVVDPTASAKEADLRRAFERVYGEAVAASQRGESVGPSQQIEEAGRRTGRHPRASEYFERLKELVARTPFRPAPGAVAALRRLRQLGWRTALVSNTVGEPGEALRPILEEMGYRDVIDAEVFSDERPWTKPSPEIFRVALSAVGVPPARAVHVGDGWVDIEGARRAGLRAGILYTGLQRYGRRYLEMFLSEGWADPPTPYRVNSWSEMPEMVERLV